MNKIKIILTVKEENIQTAWKAVWTHNYDILNPIEINKVSPNELELTFVIKKYVLEDELKKLEYYIEDCIEEEKDEN